MKEQELDELVKKLRQPISSQYGDNGKFYILGNPDGPAAAAAIQALREQVKGLQAALKGLERERDEKGFPYVCYLTNGVYYAQCLTIDIATQGNTLEDTIDRLELTVEAEHENGGLDRIGPPPKFWATGYVKNPQEPHP